MEERLLQLEQELGRMRRYLRSQNRLWAAAISSTLCFLVAGAARTEDPERVIRAPLRVVNAQEHTMFEVTEQRGQPVVRFYNGVGRKTVELTNVREGGCVSIYDRGGERAAEIGMLNVQGFRGLAVSNDQGRLAGVFNAEQPGGNVTLFGNGGKPQMGLTVGADGGVLSIYDRTGHPAVGAAAAEKGGAIMVFGREGRGGAVLAEMEQGGGLLIRDSGGKKTFSAP